MLESLHGPAWFVRREPKEAAACQRVVFADAAQSGRLVFELAEQSAAAREIAALAAEVGRIAP